MSPAPPSRPEGPDSDPKRWPVQRAESFGGVVLRSEGDTHEVILIRTRNLKGKEVWTLPKGTAEAGEAPEQTAVREVREETGIEAEIIEPLDDITYWFVVASERSRIRKTVHYFLMRAVGGDTSLHDDEVEEVRFVAVDEAPRWVTYPSDRKVLKKLAELTRSW
jgi:8-oxo-dGTP pyrophosphatase MutT (NUDIX family)